MTTSSEPAQQHETIQLKPALTELQTRLEQITDILAVLQIRAQTCNVENFEGLVMYFKTQLQHDAPQPTYDELVKRSTLAIAAAALLINDGNITRSARFLGLSRFGLQKILQRVPELSKDVDRLLKDKQPVRSLPKKKSKK